MTGSDDSDDTTRPAAPRGPERTVMVSASDLAALHGDGHPAADAVAESDPFGAAPAHDPFAGVTPSPFGALPANSDRHPRAGGDDGGVDDGAFPAADPFAEHAANPFTPAASLPSPAAAAAPPAFVPPPAAPPAYTPSAPGAFVHGTPGGLVGMHLNDLFEIVRFIAQGGMGEVYEGRNLASGEKVAIKVILPQYAADESFMALFRREASALERIGHDSLVKYRTLAFDRTSKVHYLAIEYVNGPSMADILVGDPADPAMVRRVLKRLCAGLGAAHEAGVIHRDLSPDNLLLPDGKIERCKIIDFGIAKDTNPGEKSVVGEAFAGKFGYAAPEIFGKFKRAVGPWTDVYSLALVMIAYAKGSPLDMGVTIVDALEARDTVPDLSSISPDLQPVFAKMLAPNPEERFRSMDEVIAALDAPPGSFAAASPFGGSDAAAPPAATTPPAFVRATTAPPVTKPARSKLPLYGGVAVVVLALAGGGYALLGGKTAAPDPSVTAASADSAGTSAASSMTAASGTAAPAAAAPAARADWTAVRPQVLAALTAMACSDLRVAGTPSGGTVRLAGWRPAGMTLPFGPPGWTFDTSGVEAIAAPSEATCALIDKIRTAIPPGKARAFDIPGTQILALASAVREKTGAQEYLRGDLRVTNAPSDLPELRVTTIDDSPVKPEERVTSYTLAQMRQAKFSLDHVVFDPKPGRFLEVIVASAAKLPPVTATGAPGLAAACAGGGCALASGWVEVR